MTGSPSTFAIHESICGDWLQLTVSGELDLVTVPILENRLASLRAVKAPVRLNFSKLEFIDSTGLHLLIRTVGEAQMRSWQLQIERDVAPEVLRLFKLVHLDRFVFGAGGVRALELPPEESTAK